MTPAELGAPEKFSSWRPGQDTAFQHLIDSTKRFDVLSLPPGVGKTLIGVLYAQLLGLPTVILTATKGLMEQYTEDFPNVTELRGMNNYPCKLANELRIDKKKRDVMCDEGPCLDGDKCAYKEDGCFNFDQYRKAVKSPIVISNYALWFSLLSSGKDLGERMLLICDEAHDAPSILASAIGADFRESELDIPDFPVMPLWAAWAEDKIKEVKEALMGAQTGWERRKLRDLGRRLFRISVARGDWVWSKRMMGKEKGISFEPLWAAEFAEAWLFRGIQKVVFTSASVTPQTLGYLGLTSKDFLFLDLPSPFPPARRPIIHVPTVRINQRTTEGELRIWVTRHDQIIRGRLDRKGIAHPVSYKRAKFLKEHSEYKDIMLVPWTSEETQEAVREFKLRDPPVLLVAPGIHTGYDFPYDLARYQIIGKIPFPDMTDKIVAARIKADDGYMLWSAVTKLQQTTGRVMRAEDDWGETFIIDNLIASPWIMKKNVKLFSKWWLEAFRVQAVIPQAPRMGVGS